MFALTKFRNFLHHLVDGTDDGIVTYVLRLEDGCWYVGTTRHLKKRIRNHIKGNGAKWCQIHKPLCLVGVVNGDWEEYLTKKARQKYGKEKVRGWIWVNTEHPDKVVGLNLKRLNSFNPMNLFVGKALPPSDSL